MELEQRTSIIQVIHCRSLLRTTVWEKENAHTKVEAEVNLHYDVINWYVDKFHKESNKSHDSKSN